MKLFAFVRRARRPSSSPAPEPVPAAPVDAAVPATEKRRRRPSSSGSASSWKPTLVAISEDAAVTAAKAEKAKAKPAAAKAKSRPPPPPRAARPDYDDFQCQKETFSCFTASQTQTVKCSTGAAQALRGTYNVAGVRADRVPVLSSDELAVVVWPDGCGSDVRP